MSDKDRKWPDLNPEFHGVEALRGFLKFLLVRCLATAPDRSDEFIGVYRLIGCMGRAPEPNQQSSARGNEEQTRS
jgi:hypothetical protein